MEGPAESLGGLVSVVDDARKMVHDDITPTTPLLDGKVLNVDMAGARSRLTLVDHRNGSHVVFVERSGIRLPETELSENRTEILGSLGGMTSCVKFRLGAAK